MQTLENQVSQIATSMNRLESQGKLPSQTIVNPKQNLSAVTLRSGKQLKDFLSIYLGKAQNKTTNNTYKITIEKGEKSHCKIEPA